MSNTPSNPHTAAFEAWTAYKAWMQANLGLAETMRDSRTGILSHQAQKQEVAALKAEADRLLVAAMQKLREARAAMPWRS
jgi:hypothetical protein